MFQLGKTSGRDVGHWYARRANLEALAALALLVLAIWAAGFASAGPSSTRTVYAPGKIVPIPAAIPHEAGDMVDSRIVPDLRWIAAHFPIYVVDGYSGPLPGGGHAGCDNCHVRNSDHYNGVAVDVVPLNGTTRCDATWQPITRLALWAEPTQNEPVAPFRWVGYNGDAGHGCGNHLHLSWNHAPARQFQLAEWVEVFPVGPTDEEPEATGSPRRKKRKQVKAPAAAGPAGGISVFQGGGVSPRGD